MVGVGGECLSRDLADGRKLRLYYGWESDENLLDAVKSLDGELDGPGVMWYGIEIVGGEDEDESRRLQEFSFKGGGDVDAEKAPPKVLEAFEKWYERLSSPSVEVTIEYVGSVGTEGDVDRVIAATTTHAKRLSIGFSELTPEKDQQVRKKHEMLELLRNPTAGQTEEDIQRKLREPNVAGAHKDSRVKGISLRAHKSAEDMDIAFVDYRECWILSGSVKVQFDAVEDVLKTLDFLKREGVQLDAKQVWYYNSPRRKRYEWKIGEEDVYHADAAARGENPYYPGLPAVPSGGYRWPNPTGVWKTEARDWINSHPDSARGQFTPEDIEGFYANGAVNVDVTFRAGGTGVGCEVTPPADAGARKKLADFVYSVGVNSARSNPDDEWDEDLEAELRDERAQNTSDTRPWMVF